MNGSKPKVTRTTYRRKLEKVIAIGEKGLLKVQALNPRLIILTPERKLSRKETKAEMNEIVEVLFEDDFKAVVGGYIHFDKQKFKINKIKKVEEEYYLYTQQLTKTSTFLLPLLGGNREYFKWDKNFCNAYIGTEALGDYGDSIYVAFRFSGDSDFLTFEEFLTEHPWFKERVPVDKYQDLYEFIIPEEYQEEVNLILDGNYSKISNELKDRILDFHNCTKDRPLYHILYKTKSRRKELEKELGVKIPESTELWDMFIPVNEIFKNEYIITDV